MSIEKIGQAAGQAAGLAAGLAARGSADKIAAAAKDNRPAEPAGPPPTPANQGALKAPADPGALKAPADPGDLKAPADPGALKAPANPGALKAPADTADLEGLAKRIGAYDPAFPGIEIAEDDRDKMSHLVPGESTGLGRNSGVPGRFRQNPGVSG